MTFNPIDIKIETVEWNLVLQRFFLGLIIKDVKSPISLTDGDILEMTDKSKEYTIIVEVKSINRHNVDGVSNG